MLWYVTTFRPFFKQSTRSVGILKAIFAVLEARMDVHEIKTKIVANKKDSSSGLGVYFIILKTSGRKICLHAYQINTALMEVANLSKL